MRIIKGAKFLLLQMLWEQWNDLTWFVAWVSLTQRVLKGEKKTDELDFKPTNKNKNLCTYNTDGYFYGFSQYCRILL